MKAKSKQKKVSEKIASLEVGQNFNKKDFITSIWGSSNYFIDSA